jgi:hypothetical protein
VECGGGWRCGVVEDGIGTRGEKVEMVLSNGVSLVCLDVG